MSGPPDDGSTFPSRIADKGTEAIKADPAFAAAGGDLRAFVLVYDGESAGMSYAGGQPDHVWPRSRISAGPGEIRIWLSDNEDEEWPPPWRLLVQVGLAFCSQVAFLRSAISSGHGDQRGDGGWVSRRPGRCRRDSPR